MGISPPDSGGGGGSPHPPADVANLFRREPHGWTLAYGGRSTQLKHRKGLSYIATLLREPERRVHVHELVGPAGRPPIARTAPQASDVERARKAVRNAIRNAVTTIARAHPELGRHLHNCVVTGSSCVYRPERDTAWRIEI